MISRIDNIYRPLVKGEIVRVPCVVSKDGTRITPVINTPHSDKENGQNYIHYHADNRFIIVKIKNGVPVYKCKIEGAKVFYDCDFYRQVLDETNSLQWFNIRVVRSNETRHTPVNMISKSKLKRDYEKNGKCPHRGHDLSQTECVDGIKTCPLHGLKVKCNKQN
jgi:hypothetical protein